MKILFVCSSNVCRSPFAEFVFRRLVQQSPILSSAGIEVGASAVVNRRKHILSTTVLSPQTYGLTR